jgi:lauroyl/myristoyl acyltransferase
LENVFQKRFSKIKQKQIRTASQISKLRNFRQSLIDKNLAGIYSDKDFKEQFDLIEDQLHNMALFSNQTSLEQYTKEATREYIKKKIIDLPNAYETFDIKQKRTVISLLFPKGLVWEYPGLTVVP